MENVNVTKITHHAIDAIVFKLATVVFAGLNTLAIVFPSKPLPFQGEDDGAKLYSQKGEIKRAFGTIMLTRNAAGVWCASFYNMQVYGRDGSPKPASTSFLAELKSASEKLAISLDFNKLYGELDADFIAEQTAKAKAAALNSAQEKISIIEAAIAEKTEAIEKAKVSLEEQKSALVRAMEVLEGLTVEAV